MLLHVLSKSQNEAAEEYVITADEHVNKDLLRIRRCMKYLIMKKIRQFLYQKGGMV